MKMKSEEIENGIKFAKENSMLFGRIELLRKEPLLIIDVSHNPAGMNALIETIELHFPNIKLWNFVFGCMADKDISGMLSEIKKICNVLICCTPNIERAAKSQLLEEIANSLNFSKLKLYETVKDAVNYALNLNMPTVIAGSFYLIEETIHYLKDEVNWSINDSNSLFNSKNNL